MSVHTFAIPVSATALSVLAFIATLSFISRERGPTHQEIMRAHAYKPLNPYTQDNARTQRAINALLMGAE